MVSTYVFFNTENKVSTKQKQSFDVRIAAHIDKIRPSSFSFVTCYCRLRLLLDEVHHLGERPERKVLLWFYLQV